MCSKNRRSIMFDNPLLEAAALKRQEAGKLINSSSFFENQIKRTQHNKSLTDLENFTFSNGFIQRSELFDLLVLAKNLFNTNLLLIEQLNKFHDKTCDGLLNLNHSLCLQRILNDYKIGLFGMPNEITNILVRKLLNTTTLSQLSKSDNTLDVCPLVDKPADLQSFQDMMHQYLHKEYIPYAQTMTDKSDINVLLADPIIDFMMVRHLNSPCLADDNYAPAGTFTLIGLKKYLVDFLKIVSERESQHALRKIEELLNSLCLEEKSAHHDQQSLKRAKITALEAFKKSIESGVDLPEAVVKKIKVIYPLADHGYFSRTRQLFNTVETMSNSLTMN